MSIRGISSRAPGAGMMIGLLACLVAQREAKAVPVAQILNTVTITNNSGKAANDLEMIFAGTGASIVNAKILANDGPGAVTSIVGVSNMVTINWNDGGLANGNTVKFQFYDQFPLKPDSGSGNWTYNVGAPIPIDATRDNLKITSTPEPSTLVLGVIGLLGGLGWSVRRRLSEAA